MLGLTFQGDPVKSTGEYLPSPYINKVTINEDTITADIIVFINNVVSGFVLTPSGVSEADDAYNNRVLGTGIIYYILWLKGFSEEEYQSLTNGDVNPLYFFHNNSGGQKFLNVLNVDQSSKKQFLDKDRNFIDVFVASDRQIITNPDYVMCFASTFDYFTNSYLLSRTGFSQIILDLQTSEVSYERIYNSDDTLNTDGRLDFLDNRKDIYDMVPLQSIDKTIYKIGAIDHKYIKDNIESLLSEYDTENNSQLKTVVDSIYLTLETGYEDYDILNKLDTLRKSFPNKSPSTDVGKLYKRFSRRLSNINTTVRQEEQVYKTINYNSKVQMGFSASATASPTISNDDGAQIIYTDWKATNLEVSSRILSKTYNVIFGYFFLDYEKLLRKDSYASQFVDVSKLEKLGLHIPYEKFYIEEISMYDRDSSDTSDTSQLIVITNMQSGSAYPVAEEETPSSLRGDIFTEPELYFRNALKNTPYGSERTANTTAANGFCTHLINRKYTPIYDNTSDIEDYRLMLFEYLEYRDYRDYTANTYVYDVHYRTKDRTFDILLDLSDSLQNAIDQMTEYQTFATEACTFNSDLGIFNQFFTNAMAEMYKDAAEQAPWYTAAAIYVMQMDLLYDTYGGDLQQIENAASLISRNIDPFTGTLTAINDFVDSLTNLKTNTWDAFIAGRRDLIRTINYTVTLSIPTAQEVE